MQTRKRGVIAVIDSAIGLGLLFLDAWGRESQLHGLLPPSWHRFLPVAYGLCFLVALILVKGAYESADFDFVIDPRTEYVRESDESYCYADTYRVSVLNRG